MQNHPMRRVVGEPSSNGDLHGSSPAERESDVRLAPALVRVSVVIPARNEEKNLPHILPRLPQDIHELILVDGQSADDTIATARALYPSVRLVHQAGAGKGDALACGFAAVTGDVIVTLDADGSTNPAEIPRFVHALMDGADYAKGSRFVHGGGSDDITPLRAFGNRVLTGLVNLLFGTRYSDLCYGFNAFWAELSEFVSRDVPGFEIETAMNVRVAKAGLNVFEVASREGARVHGVSNLKTFRDGWRVLRTILRERFSSRPMEHLPDALLESARARRLSCIGKSPIRG